MNYLRTEANGWMKTFLMVSIIFTRYRYLRNTEESTEPGGWYGCEMTRLNPDYQLGEGCLVDQLVGQYVAHVCGLGYLLIRKMLNPHFKA